MKIFPKGKVFFVFPGRLLGETLQLGVLPQMNFQWNVCQVRHSSGGRGRMTLADTTYGPLLNEMF